MVLKVENNVVRINRPLYLATRLKEVRRWHMLPRAFDQTLSDHLGAVAQIADALADVAEIQDPQERLAILYWAIHHDDDEVALGDVSPPFKNILSQTGCRVKTGVVVGDHDTEERARQWAGDRWEVVREIVKVADIVEAILHLDIFSHENSPYATNARAALMGILFEKERSDNRTIVKVVKYALEYLNGSITHRDIDVFGGSHD